VLAREINSRGWACCALTMLRCAALAGEINFDLVGVMYQLGSIVTESIRLVMVQILLQVSSASSTSC
jgi:hypothetical protein